MAPLTARVDTPPATPPDAPDGPHDVANCASSVRAAVRNRGQGERGRGAGLRMQVPVRPATAASDSRDRAGTLLSAVSQTLNHSSTADLRARLGQRWPFYTDAPASASMQRSLRRSHNGLLAHGAANASAFLPVSLHSAPPPPSRGSSDSGCSSSSFWTTRSKGACMGPAISSTRSPRRKNPASPRVICSATPCSPRSKPPPPTRATQLC
jgi:hypothetical protein